MAWCYVTSAHAAPARRAAPTFSAPLETTVTRHLAVQVHVNGRGPFRLIFDTGSPITFISARAAQKIGLISQRQAQRPAMMGMRGQFVARSLQVGSARVDNIGITILDHPVIGVVSQIAGPIDGIVGFSFFSRFRTVIDQGAGRVFFTPINYLPRDATEAITERLLSGAPSVRLVSPRALWGMTVQELKTPKAATNAKSATNLNPAGVVVTRVFTGGAAQQGGLRAGDVITAIGGRWTESVAACFEAAANVEAGQTTIVQVLRAGKFLTLQVRPRAGL